MTRSPLGQQLCEVRRRPHRSSLMTRSKSTIGATDCRGRTLGPSFLQQDEGIFILASLLPIGITISRRSAVPVTKHYGAHTMKFSLIAIAASCALTTSAFAMNTSRTTSADLGMHAPRL